jgi:hypothetical protein
VPPGRGLGPGFRSSPTISHIGMCTYIHYFEHVVFIGMYLGHGMYIHMIIYIHMKIQARSGAIVARSELRGIHVRYHTYVGTRDATRVPVVLEAPTRWGGFTSAASPFASNESPLATAVLAFVLSMNLERSMPSTSIASTLFACPFLRW